MEGLRANESFDPKSRIEQLRNSALSARELLQLPSAERTVLMSESARTMLGLLRATKAVEFENIEDMYESLRGEHMLVRREDPARVLELVGERNSIDIDFPGNDRYSNAVLWTPDMQSQGLRNAYLEGYGQLNGTVAVLGFRQSGHIDVQALPDAEQRFAGLDRTNVRSIKGTIYPDDVLFVSLRVPSTAFPESEMTDVEHEKHEAYIAQRNAGDTKNPAFIHRGFLFTRNIQKQ
jgi:hypothetical protein